VFGYNTLRLHISPVTECGYTRNCESKRGTCL